MATEGIKETKEAIIGINELCLVLVAHLADGLQLGKDVPAIIAELMTNSELINAMQKGLEGMEKIPGEIQDIDLKEGVELGMLLMSYVSRYADALSHKKSEAPSNAVEPDPKPA